MARVTAVCVTKTVRQRTVLDDHPTGIDKGPIGRLEVMESGAIGDQVLDLANHGGTDKALYAYSDEDAAFWEDRLGEEVPAGRFGENLRTVDLDLGAQVIGQRWRIGGEVVVEVSEPRVPCLTFQHHMGDREGWVQEFRDANRTGTYLRVLKPGAIDRGATIEVMDAPSHGITIADWFGDHDAEMARALLDAANDVWQPAASLQAFARQVLERD